MGTKRCRDIVRIERRVVFPLSLRAVFVNVLGVQESIPRNNFARLGIVFLGP